MPSKITPAATLARVQELHDGGNSFRKIGGNPRSGRRPGCWAAIQLASCQRQLVFEGDWAAGRVLRDLGLESAAPRPAWRPRARKLRALPWPGCTGWEQAYKKP